MDWQKWGIVFVIVLVLVLLVAAIMCKPLDCTKLETADTESGTHTPSFRLRGRSRNRRRKAVKRKDLTSVKQNNERKEKEEEKAEVVGNEFKSFIEEDIKVQSHYQATSCFLTRTKTRNVKKLAIFMGLSYESHPEYKLDTCLNDVVAMAKHLKEEHAYESSDMYWLTDVKNAELPFGCVPVEASRDNLIRVWDKVIAKACKSSSSSEAVTEVVFMFSGHGACKPSPNDPNETDGQKECFVMPDLSPLWDHDFRDRILKRLPKQCRVLIISDACHSGSAADLPWIYNSVSHKLDQETQESNTIKASVAMISGCEDNQTSAAGPSARSLSILSSALLHVLKNRRTISLVDCINALHVSLSKHHQAQIPMLSFSHAQDMEAMLQ